MLKRIANHTHTNGDEATNMLDCVERGLRLHNSPDHRFTLQHRQPANAAHTHEGTGDVSTFPNHHFYWGDQHYSMTVGPERAERMNACATALANGVPLAIHPDAPVTPPRSSVHSMVLLSTAKPRVVAP